MVQRASKPAVNLLAANLGLSRPPAIYLIAIRGPGIAFYLADPIRSELGKAVRRVDRGSCCHAFHLVDQNIPLNGHAGAWKSTDYRRRQGRAVTAPVATPFISRSRCFRLESRSGSTMPGS
jgi:hypothetical protein